MFYAFSTANGHKRQEAAHKVVDSAQMKIVIHKIQYHQKLKTLRSEKKDFHCKVELIQ